MPRGKNIMNISERDSLIKSISEMSLSDLSSLSNFLPIVIDSKLQTAMNSDNLEKAIEAGVFMEKVRRKNDGGEKSILFLPDSIAYNGRGYKETLSRTTFQTLQRMGNLYCVKNIISTRIEQITQFLTFTTDSQKEGFTIRKKRSLFDTEDPKLNREDKKKAEAIVRFLENGGETEKWDNRDTFITFMRKIIQDSLTIDQLAFEITRRRDGQLDKFQAIDASMIRLLDSNDPRYEKDFERYRYKGYLPRYCQVFDQQIVFNPVRGEYVLYYPWELGFGVRNLGTDIWNNGYGKSELESLIEIVTYILNAIQYNGNFFKNGSNPKGFIKMKQGASQNQLAEFKQKWRQLLSGPNNCLSGDTEIWLRNEGNIQIEEFLGDSEEKFTQIWTGTEFQNARVYKTGLKKKCILKLGNGIEITSSPNHKFKVVSDNGVIEWKERKDIKIGDYVLCNKTPICGEKRFYYKGKEIGTDLFEILGWLTGDGHIGDNKRGCRQLTLFYHQERERSIRGRHFNILRSYGVNCHLYEHYYTPEEKQKIINNYGFKSVADSRIGIVIYDADFYKFLIDIGFQQSRLSKVIPHSLFTVSSSNRCAFLRGFFSADGSVVLNGLGVNITISSDNLRQQTRMLLLAEGIQCSVYEGRDLSKLGKKNKKGVYLQVKDREEFYSRVGFLQPHKQYTFERKKNYSTINSLPSSMAQLEAKKMRVELYRREVFGEKKEKFNNSFNINLYSISVGNDTCSYQRLRYLAEKISYSLPEDFYSFWFSQVVELNSSDEEVSMYDVEVFDDKHQFIANGALVHNSHKIPIFAGPDIEWVNLQQGNREMEFDEWTKFLMILLCSVYRIDPSELGFSFQDGHSVFGQDGQRERLQHSKQKGLYPLLIFFQDIINKYIISEIDENYEFVFTGIDVEDEEKQVQLDAQKLQSGMVSLQDMFKKYSGRDFDEENDIILNSVYLQYKQMNQFGGDQMNEMVDEETGEEGDIPNPFEDTEQQIEQSLKDNPIAKSAFEYINQQFNRDERED